MAKRATKPVIPAAPTDVCMMSMWRDDEQRGLVDRIAHLLGKQGVQRWLWLVGNSSDQTEAVLRAVAADCHDVTVLRFDSDVLGDDPDSRLTRLSQTANVGLAAVRDTDKWFVIHESDLVSPVDIVPRLLSMQVEEERRAFAGWPMLGDLFYDTFAYRKDGHMFSNHRPFSHAYAEGRVFEVDSAGSVLAFEAQCLRDGLRIERGGMVEICLKLKAQGVTIWVDPTLIIQQPTHLWESSQHANF